MVARGTSMFYENEPSRVFRACKRMVPCRHGQLQCASCIPQWQQRGAFATQNSSLVNQEWQSGPSSSSQSSSSTSSSTPNTSNQQVWHGSSINDAETDALAMSFPSFMQNSAQNRLQIQSRFDDLHMGASSNARSIFNYEALYTTNASPKLRATTSALDTLCLAQIATSFNDQTLSLNARLLYGKTISYLRQRLDSVASGQLDRTALDDIVGAVHVLSACSWFNCLETDSLEWVYHTQALLNILEVYGWESLHPSTARSFYVAWKYRAFLEGLVQKRPFPFKEPPNSIGASLPTSFLGDYVLGIPGLLWRGEKIFQQASMKTVPRRIVLALLTEIEKSISKLKQWHLQWTKSFPARPHYRTVSTRSFKHFSLLAGDLISVFPTAYDFTHPIYERDFRMLCICLLHLDQVVINIHCAFPDFCTEHEFNLQLRSAEYDAETCAADLCMLIPWTSQPQNNSFASIHAQRPLDYAIRFYQSQSKEPQLSWCLRVSQALKEKYGLEIKFPG